MIILYSMIEQTKICDKCGEEKLQGRLGNVMQSGMYKSLKDGKKGRL